jgi:hypothetical protein
MKLRKEKEREMGCGSDIPYALSCQLPVGLSSLWVQVQVGVKD